MAKVAINGLGRIGRAVFKTVLDTPGLDLVGINDLIPPDNLAYLLKYDTVYGRWNRAVEAEGQNLVVDGTTYGLPAEKDPANLPWGDRDVDLVFECTGVFRKRDQLEKHVAAGAKRVILSAPAKGGGVPIVLYGVNAPPADDKIISCGSCTTNSVGPVVEVMDRRIGLEKVSLTTIHAYTASQSIVDGPHDKWTRGRAAAANFVPTSTGAAQATTKVLTDLEGKFDGVAVRGPTPAGSLSDLVMLTREKTTADAVKDLMTAEADGQRYKGVMGVSSDPLVSSDVIADPHATVVDLNTIQVIDGDLVKLMTWYDNEWGYVNQMIRTASAWTG